MNGLNGVIMTETIENGEDKKMITKNIDGITFQLKSEFDFTWLSEFGAVFTVFDQQDSGNICFGVKNKENKYFIKFAGAPTVNYSGDRVDVMNRKKGSMAIYEDIKHPNLIRLLGHKSYKDGYISIFEWAEGECLHAHWDFEKYPKYKHPKSPNHKFKQLDLRDKLQCLNDIFSLHCYIISKGYVAIDFYDGSIMYDFINNKTTICDIEFYQKRPVINTMGRMWGSSRFMSSEEYEIGATIDEVTNVYTMGATAFELLGSNKFRCFEYWEASEGLFKVALKAVSKNRRLRYATLHDFYNAWNRALNLSLL